MLRGSSVPLGKDRSEIRISLSDTVQHSSARDILKGSLEVKSNKDSRVVSIRKVLDVFAPSGRSTPDCRGASTFGN